MKIGVLGTGDVGRVLAGGFAGRGHEVVIGTRDPRSDKARDLQAALDGGVRVVSFAEAARFGELVVFAVGWDHAKAVVDMAGPASFADKVVIDATNPLRFVAEGQPPELAVGHTDSAGEQVQRWLPTAKVVKAFNIVGNPHMVDPNFPDGKPDMFIAGDDEGAKQLVDGLIRELGWPPAVDLGGIQASRYLEPLAMVWITHFFRSGFNGNHAFKLLRK